MIVALPVLSLTDSSSGHGVGVSMTDLIPLMLC